MSALQRKTFATQGNLNNHIGVPLFERHRAVECLVLELGTSGAGELSTRARLARPTVGVITSIAEEHTETLKDLNGVIEAETELIAALPPEVRSSMATTMRCWRPCIAWLVVGSVTFGECPRQSIRVTNINARTGTSFSVSTPAGQRDVHVKLLGSHFASPVQRLAQLRQNADLMPPVQHYRPTAQGAGWQWLKSLSACDHFDDCYNANPASMRQAFSRPNRCVRPVNVYSSSWATCWSWGT
jgi:UDP-N-acetylmuramoyl-tripeptide--D-alanyl-D-alanine ligase